MQTLSYTEARANLSSIMKKTVQDRAPIMITKKGRDEVVLLSAEEYRSWEETLYLLSYPANARRLQEGLTEVAEGRLFSHGLLSDE